MELTWEKIKEILDKNNIRMYETTKETGNLYNTELEFWSDLDEDIIFDIQHNNQPDNFLYEFTKYTEKFDPGSHAGENIINRINNPKCGIPNNDTQLYEDAKEIKKFLINVVEELANSKLTEEQVKTKTLKKKINKLLDKIEEIYVIAIEENQFLNEEIDKINNADKNKNETIKKNYTRTQVLTADLIRHLGISKDLYLKTYDKIPGETTFYEEITF